MKTIKTFTFTFSLFLFSNLLLATNNFKGDTIRYRFDKMLIEVASEDFTSYSLKNNTIKERIEQIRSILSEMSIEIPANDEMISILFRDQGEDHKPWDHKEIDLSYEKKTKKKLVVLDDGKFFDKEFGRYCIYYADYFGMEMKVYVESLSDLDYFGSEDFNKKLENGSGVLLEKLGKNFNKMPVSALLDFRENEIKAYHLKSTKALWDMLLITFGVGTGWGKNSFVSSFDYNMGLGFSKKGVMKNIYTVEWNTLYDFSESNDNNFFELNHFVSLGWEHNFSNSPLEDKWYGFSVGYLAIRNNDFFKENTFRLSVKKKINDSISLKPELYFNDFLKDVYPGIRVTVAF